MRFAPPNPLRIADRASGLNALSVRSYNERLVLSLLLQNEGISRMEIGEKTGLSAQTASVIVRSLEQEGLVSQGEAQRGRVGPPTIPLSLNPEGAYAVGVGFSRHRIDIALIDFIGTVRFHKPTEGFRGKFSLDYVLAAMVLDARVDLDSFSDEYCNSPRMRASLDKVVIHSHHEWADDAATRRRAPVTITMKDGRKFVNEVEKVRGSPGNPVDARVSPPPTHRSPPKLRSASSGCSAMKAQPESSPNHNEAPTPLRKWRATLAGAARTQYAITLVQRERRA